MIYSIFIIPLLTLITLFVTLLISALSCFEEIRFSEIGLIILSILIVENKKIEFSEVVK